MKFMRLIQIIIMIIFMMIALVFETAFRICLFPMAIVVLILMQLCGLKSTINSDTWSTIWKYSMPWNFGRYYITNAVANYLAPEGF